MTERLAWLALGCKVPLIAVYIVTRSAEVAVQVWCVSVALCLLAEFLRCAAVGMIKRFRTRS